MKVSEKVLEKCNTLEEFVDCMVTDKEGNRLNYSDVGETKDFISRFNSFKEYLEEGFPTLSFEDVLFIFNNYKVVNYVVEWKGFDRLLAALEFEQRKNKP